MRLLICAQAVDKDDPALGFFHEWIANLSPKFTSIEVIALGTGRYSLPHTVTIYSLGKESGRGSRLHYAVRFLSLAWSLRNSYDAVFVHQNQEYVLLSGWLWRLMGKKIFLWRNHYAGTFLTDIASLFCDKVFCTSNSSYTARYKKTVRMPIGVDTSLFKPGITSRAAHSVLFLGRMAPSKRPHVLIEALGMLAASGVVFTASLYGPTLPKDIAYLSGLKRRANELHISDRIIFREGVAHIETPALYASHEIFVNLSGTGMYDKTMFEAAASGCIVIATSRDLAQHINTRFIPRDDSVEALAHVLRYTLGMTPEEKAQEAPTLRKLAEANSLQTLANLLSKEMNV